MREGATAKRVRVCLIGPSMDIVGGQAVQLQRLLSGLGESERLEVSFLPVNPRLPGALRGLQRVKYMRTIITSIAYVSSLIRVARNNDVLHAFSASYWSYILAPRSSPCRPPSQFSIISTLALPPAQVRRLRSVSNRFDDTTVSGKSSASSDV